MSKNGSRILSSGRPGPYPVTVDDRSVVSVEPPPCSRIRTPTPVLPYPRESTIRTPTLVLVRRSGGGVRHESRSPSPVVRGERGPEGRDTVAPGVDETIEVVPVAVHEPTPKVSATPLVGGVGRPLTSTGRSGSKSHPGPRLGKGRPRGDPRVHPGLLLRFQESNF